MGIRFRCHHCEKQLHVKDFQAGKRGKCPKCKASFRIPKQNADYSLSLEPAGQEVVGAGASHSTSDSQSFSSKASADIDAALGLESPSEFAAGSDLPESLTEYDAQEQLAETQEPVRLNPAENQPAENAREESPREPPPSQPPEENEKQRPTASAFWYVRPPSGGQFGPADQEVFEQWLAENRVTSDSLIWRDGWEEWKPAAEAIPDAFPRLKDASPSTNLQTAPLTQATDSSQPSLGERNRLERKQKRKRNYKIMLGSLIILTLVLLSALVVALLNQ